MASSIWGSVKSVGKDVLSRTGKGLIDKVLGGGHSSGYSSGYDDSYGSEDYGSEDDGSEGEYSDYRCIFSAPLGCPRPIAHAARTR